MNEAKTKILDLLKSEKISEKEKRMINDFLYTDFDDDYYVLSFCNKYGIEENEIYKFRNEIIYKLAEIAKDNNQTTQTSVIL